MALCILFQPTTTLAPEIPLKLIPDPDDLAVVVEIESNVLKHVKGVAERTGNMYAAWVETGRNEAAGVRLHPEILNLVVTRLRTVMHVWRLGEAKGSTRTISAEQDWTLPVGTRELADLMSRHAVYTQANKESATASAEVRAYFCALFHILLVGLLNSTNHPGFEVQLNPAVATADTVSKEPQA